MSFFIKFGVIHTVTIFLRTKKWQEKKNGGREEGGMLQVRNTGGRGIQQHKL